MDGRRWSVGRLAGHGHHHRFGATGGGVHGSCAADANAPGLRAGTLTAEETYDGLGLFRLVYTTFVAGSLYAFSVVFTGSSCGVSCGTLWVGGGCRSGQQISGNTNAGKREIEKRIF